MTSPKDAPLNPWAAPRPGYQQPGYPQPGYQQPGYQQPGYGQPMYVMPLKSCAVAYLLWFFLGGLGIHHFYLGRTTPGIILLVLCLIGWATSWLGVGLLLIGAVGIWLFVELFLIPGYTREANARLTGYPMH